VTSRLLFALLVSTCGLAQRAPVPSAAAPAMKPGLYVIAGSVVNNASGEALADALVSLAPNTDRRDVVTISSDVAGHFSFPNVPPGKYALSAKRRGFVQQALDQHDSFSTAVVAGPGLDSEHIVFRLTPAVSISGNVLDEDNEPVANAQLWLFQKSIQMGTALTFFRNATGTNDRGHFRFAGLAPGTYYLAVTGQPWYAQGSQRPMSRFNAGHPPEPETDHSPFDVAYPLTYYDGASDFETAKPLVLTSGNSVTANITLRAVPSVHLKLELTPDEAARPPNLQFFHDGPGGTRMYTSASQYNDGSGTYMGGFAPGHYEVELQHFDPKTGNLVDRGTQSLDAQGDGTFEPSTHASGSISGKVILPRPIAAGEQLVIELLGGVWRGSSPFSLSSTIAPDGSISFPGTVRPGKYEAVIAGDPDLTVQSVTATGAKVNGRTVELTGSGTVELTIVVASGKRGEVNGFVMKDDKAVAGAMVLLIPEDSRLAPTFLPRDQSDTDGSFVIARVMPGKYRALAIDDGTDLEYTNPETIKPYLNAAQSIVVPPNGKVNIKVALQTRVN
jgi:Carboxypeptidase regulatory-like domain